MPKYRGSDFRVYIEVSPGLYRILPGERRSSISFANEAVDTTAKEDGWRQLSPCGTKGADVQADGFITNNDPTITSLVLGSLLGTSTFLLVVANAETQSVVWAGRVSVVSYERAGEYNNAETYNISFKSTTSQLMNSPVLDLFPAAIDKQGWSMRRIRSGYSGPVIRIRRESDNAESDIGFRSDNNYVDEQAVQSFCAGSRGRLVRMYQQGTSGIFSTIHDLVRITATSQPNVTDAAGVPYLYNGVLTARTEAYTNSGLTMATFLNYSVPYLGNYRERGCLISAVGRNTTLATTAGGNRMYAQVVGGYKLGVQAAPGGKWSRLYNIDGATAAEVLTSTYPTASAPFGVAGVIGAIQNPPFGGSSAQYGVYRTTQQGVYGFWNGPPSSISYGASVPVFCRGTHMEFMEFLHFFSGTSTMYPDLNAGKICLSTIQYNQSQAFGMVYL